MMQQHSSQGADVPHRDKSASTDKQSAEQGKSKKASSKTGPARSEAEERAWAIANKGHGGAKIGLGRKVPSGPVGGSGRKTNLARSS
jgi:hypothetical protein